jgi:transcriptional regulator with XRE-family HTH domain
MVAGFTSESLAGIARNTQFPSVALPQALRVLRLIAGLERDELGAAIGATKLVLQNYERGITPPPAGTLPRAAGRALRGDPA